MLLIQRKKKSEQAGKGKAYVTNSKEKKNQNRLERVWVKIAVLDRVKKQG